MDIRAPPLYPIYILIYELLIYVLCILNLYFMRV